MLRTGMQASETNHLRNAALELNYELPYWFLIILNNIFQYISVCICLFVTKQMSLCVYLYKKVSFKIFDICTYT